MKFITRIFYFLSLFLLFVIFKELVELIVLAKSVHPILGWATVGVLLAAVVYFIAIPIFKILKIPKNYGPTKDPDKVPELVQRRIEKFRSNPYLLQSNYDFSNVPENQEGYDQIIQTLGKEGERIRKKYVLQLFYSSSISQNGFLDAILILSSSVNLVRELFILYHGRVTNKDLWEIAKRIYFSMAIGGSEGVEYATQEFFSKFATEGMKSVPFADRIFGSLADGFINAALLTRVSLITENYCKMIYIRSDRELLPSSEFIIRATKFITGDILEKLTIELIRMSKDKTVDYVMLAVNPVGHLVGRTYGAVRDGTTKLASYQMDILRDVANLVHKPIGYGIDKFTSIFKKKDKLDLEGP